jgi:hypothetical protein
MKYMEYNVDYFIRKFSAIPEYKWFVGDYSDGHLIDPKCCARGHCGKRRFGVVCEEDDALLKLFDFNLLNRQCIAHINDGRDKNYPQPTPKQRILAALYDIKRKQDPQFNHPPVTVEDLIGEPAHSTHP